MATSSNPLDFSERVVIDGAAITRMRWAIWKPYDSISSKGQTYSGESLKYNTPLLPKIVLYNYQAFEPPTTWAKPPHFSLNLEVDGRAWQHVSLTRAAYGLEVARDPSSGRIVSENTEAGITIQIAILSPEPYQSQYYNDVSGWWHISRISRLAWWLGSICNVDLNPGQYKSYVKMECPLRFNNTPHYPDTTRQALTWLDWQGFGGILGRMHAPFDNGKWGPGNLNTDQLQQQVRMWETLKEPKSAEVAGTPAGDELIEEETGSGGTDDSGADAKENKPTEEVSMETKPWRFNPPLHKDNHHARIEFASDDPDLEKSKSYYNREPTVGNVPMGAAGVEQLTQLRLGRIIQYEMAAGLAGQNAYRYGFRFLYNPTSVTVSASRNDSVYINPSTSHDSIVSGINQNFQLVTLRLMLNRKPDVLLKPLSGADYMPGIDQTDIDGIQKYGTHWDLQYLYLVCNGEWDLDDRGKTSDIGFISPASARLLLGQLNLFGFVESINYEDVLFSGGMVPILTQVDLTYRRHVDIQDKAAFALSVGGRTSEEEEEDAPAGTSLPGGGVTADAVKGNTKDAPCPGHNNVTRPFEFPWSGYTHGVHTGVDFGGGGMGGSIRATRGGQVFHAGALNIQNYGSAYGNGVVIQTGDIQHLYAHMSKVLVKTGQSVLEGDEIGKVGTSGCSSCGAHLHYEEREKPYRYGTAKHGGGNCIDPIWANRR